MPGAFITELLRGMFSDWSSVILSAAVQKLRFLNTVERVIFIGQLVILETIFRNFGHNFLNFSSLNHFLLNKCRFV